MAFKNIERDMYNGAVTLKYKDSTHRYRVTVRRDENGNLDPEGTEEAFAPISATGIKNDTLEKKGLQLWPMGLAMRYLLGFYDFENEEGKKLFGFSSEAGVLWDCGLSDRDEVLKHCLAAAKAWTVKQKEGADIGTLVHDAVEQYITGTPFEITVEAYRSRVAEKEGEEFITDKWLDKAPEEVVQANQAFDAFKTWWNAAGATVVLAEEILYSAEDNIAGTMDYLLQIPGKGMVLADLKTTKASARAGAPQGVYYDFFIQLGMYAGMLVEMGHPMPDDVMIVSARKDGGFTPVYASEVGLSVLDCINWASHVIEIYKYMKTTKKALKTLAGAKEDAEE